MIKFIICALNFKRNSFMSLFYKQEIYNLHHDLSSLTKQQIKKESWLQKYLSFLEQFTKINFQTSYFARLKDHTLSKNAYDILGFSQKLKKVNLLLAYFGLKPQVYTNLIRPKAKNSLQVFIKSRPFWSTQVLNNQIDKSRQLRNYLRQVLFKYDRSFHLAITYPSLLQQQFRIQVQLQIKQDHIIQIHDADQPIKH